MLENTLQQERAEMQSCLGDVPTQIEGSGAAEDVLISHPLSHLSTPSEHSINASIAES